MLDDGSIRSVADAYIDALNRRDREGFLLLFADDAEQHDPIGEPARVGVGAIARWWDSGVMRWDSFAIEAREVYVAGGSAALVWTIAEGHDGKKRSFSGVDVLRFDDQARIKSVCAYWERGSLADFQ